MTMQTRVRSLDLFPHAPLQFEIFSLDVNFLSPACLGYRVNFYTRFRISAGLVFAGIVIPWIVAAIVAVVAGCRAKIRGGDGIGDGGGEGEGSDDGREVPGFGQIVRATWRRAQPAAARYSLMIVQFAHPAVSGQTFYFFSCHDIDGAAYVKEK
jgi:hypothetical protein